MKKWLNGEYVEMTEEEISELLKDEDESEIEAQYAEEENVHND